MPRDWKNDPKVIKRYCACTWLPAPPDDVRYILTSSDTPMVRDASKCPLHGEDPDGDAPEDW